MAKPGASPAPSVTGSEHKHSDSLDDTKGLAPSAAADDVVVPVLDRAEGAEAFRLYKRRFVGLAGLVRLPACRPRRHSITEMGYVSSC